MSQPVPGLCISSVPRNSSATRKFFHFQFFYFMHFKIFSSKDSQLFF